ncbi:hypothetical protein [Sporosarcina sp. ACRSL]|uniref:hypothetical protein n=1 Tax=Sporosarcina sp. ACRSL TaxID=2918215 RepID=UPI001EF7110A|nr:hypothetical protein [Sporosarcina sp. ACRSL]
MTVPTSSTERLASGAERLTSSAERLASGAERLTSSAERLERGLPIIKKTACGDNLRKRSFVLSSKLCVCFYS